MSRPTSPTPLPFDLERRPDFITRFMGDKEAKRFHERVFKRRLAAEAAWMRAKAASLVSITTTREEFMLF